jgi:DNA-binding NarL/FixJ family response regulator
MISVAIVEDNPGIRRTLTLLLEESPGFRCVCACGSAEEALRAIPRAAPDVVLMDIHLPNLSGIECTGRLKELVPKVQVVMITVYADVEKVFCALRAGASGYLLKRAAPEQILQAITEVSTGGAPMTSEIARKLVEAFKETPPSAPPTVELSRREQEILELLSQGFANKEIAQNLNISFDTVRWHLKQIYDKLHVRSRTEAVVKFLGREGGSSLPEAAGGLPGRAAKTTPLRGWPGGSTAIE